MFASPCRTITVYDLHLIVRRTTVSVIEAGL